MRLESQLLAVAGRASGWLTLQMFDTRCSHRVMQLFPGRHNRTNGSIRDVATQPPENFGPRLTHPFHRSQKTTSSNGLRPFGFGA